ncbi:negative regulator of pho regulon for phosphate transport [Streptococcus dysgalactiae subsp. dysgalactiae]|uniref:Phosphate-specific transport system accessory protein PhoU n=2 Tax=Streptococcus dysgalactiae TaxID=1334 RepID=A0A380JZQ0_STRDY|nr:phosphate signaling complex protein PhoU [Streptococcus dysgalactiae]EFY02278.1 phosphate transport system regulatory protein PhoU [Streptococcus dysgalactiae subsp. dysgalactiae ATCC 27957]MCB2829692.1 phosphate signaling complex protein PhoU [Streptococcus dysgalactiae subsp. dysgalactiae]MCB2830950.1 phosphate signaling complex protein PhoU [Streptococcus dysgalactiae subsp. dysgalactiae]MCB2833077.1 phosphate signaling complex protein PhoU [Streptococcus dysgalactiae subsp. dysgalactiae]
MRDQFELELQELEHSFLELGQLVLETGSKTLLALASKDKDMAEQIIARDQKINQRQSAIELACARMLALQQPQVSDLRFVISIMSSCSDLERMGDHMTGIAKAILQLKEDQLSPSEDQLHLMGQSALRMLADLLETFPLHQASKAVSIAQTDEQIDQHYYALSKEIISLMKDQETSIPNGTQYLYIIGHLERFADYIANICERVVYLETGELIDLN